MPITKKKYPEWKYDDKSGAYRLNLLDVFMEGVVERDSEGHTFKGYCLIGGNRYGEKMFTDESIAKKYVESTFLRIADRIHEEAGVFNVIMTECNLNDDPRCINLPLP